MAQHALVKIGVEREERCAPHLKQKGNYLFVFHPFASNVTPNLPNGNSPIEKQLTLAFKDVFI